MSTLVILIFVLWCAYRAFRRPVISKRPAVPRTRAETSGDLGEARVLSELRTILPWLCGNDYYVHPCAVLLHHAPGTAFPTAEVDHLVVTPFGIFVIETKNWSGRIAPGADATSLLCHLPDGKLEERRSPLAQNRTKVAFLRAMLPAVWDIHGVGVFSNGACALSPDLPLALIRVNDLAHWMRGKKEQFDQSGKPAINVPAAWDAIQHLCIGMDDDTALADHRQRVRHFLPI
ncbi:NERD domain-containing protein [Burkholderia sp. Ac-20353]|nr:NERD domain-containing protein [Burkholderia sp. Ac-20353]